MQNYNFTRYSVYIYALSHREEYSFGVFESRDLGGYLDQREWRKTYYEEREKRLNLYLFPNFNCLTK